MFASLLPVAIALIPFAVIIFSVYRFVGKKAGKITGLVFGAILMVALAFALFGAPSAPKGTLHITEWRMNLALTPNISDAYYMLEDNEVYISTKRLDRLVDHTEGCTSTLHGLYYMRDPHNPIKLIDGQPRAEPACVVQVSGDTDKIRTLQEAIQAAAQTATTD